VLRATSSAAAVLVIAGGSAALAEGPAQHSQAGAVSAASYRQPCGSLSGYSETFRSEITATGSGGGAIIVRGGHRVTHCLTRPASRRVLPVPAT
jgi:hypothetical protein